MAVGLATCSDAPLATVTSGNSPQGRPGLGRIALQPIFSKAAAAAAQRMAGFGISFDNVRLVIRGTPDTLIIVKDTTVHFDPQSSDLALDLIVPVQSDGQRFDATIDYRNGTEVVFHGHAIVTSHSPNQPAPPQATLTIDYVGPGANVARIAVAPPTLTLSGGQSATLTATAFDSSGAAMALPPINWSSSDPSVVTIDADGVAHAQNRRGSVTLTASTPTAVSAGATAKVVLPPASITLVSGGGQKGRVGSALDAPAIVQVNAGDGVGVPGVSVVFSAPVGGSVGTTSATTDDNGRASSTLRLGNTAGPQSFAATAAGFSVAIPETAVAGEPAVVAIVSGSGQSDTVRKTLSPLVVKVTDSFQNPVAGVVVSWSVVTGAGTLAQVTSTTDDNGQASTGFTLGSTAGPVDVTASVTGVTQAATFDLTAVPAAPAAIVIVSGQEQSGRVGEALARPFVVRVLDATNAPVPGATVHWVAAGGGLAESTTTDANGESSNVMTLGNIAGSASARAEIADGTSVVFSASAFAGPPTALVFATQPANAVAGAPLAAVSVRTVDRYGNLSPSTVNVTISLGSQQEATLHGTLSRAAVAGVATFDDLQLDVAGTGYTLVASAAAMTSATSAPFNVSGGAVATLSVVAGENQTVTVGSAASTAPSVRVLDGSGNPLVGIAVTFTPANGSGSVVPAGGIVQTNALGIATLTSWTLGTTPGAQSLTVSAAGVPSVTFHATVKEGSPAQIIPATPETQTSFTFVAGTTPVDPPKLEVADAFGNSIAGVPVTIVATTIVEGQSVTVGTANFTTDANGHVGFDGALPTTAGTYTLTATSVAVPNASLVVTVVITPAPITPGSLTAISELPTVALVGTELGVPLRVLVKDVAGSPMSGVAVTFTVTAGGGALSDAQPGQARRPAAALTGRRPGSAPRTAPPAAPSEAARAGGLTAVTVTTDANGTAIVWSWVLGPAEGTNTVTATVGTLSAVFSVTASDVHRMAFVGTPPTTLTVGEALASPVRVQLTDAQGNPLPKSGVVVTASEQPTQQTEVPPHLSGTLQAVTDESGQATFDDLRDSSRVQTVRLAFDATTKDSALPTLYSEAINVVAGKAARLSALSAIELSTTVGAPFAAYPSVMVTDIAGNPIPDLELMLSTTGTCEVTPRRATDAAGIATLDANTFDIAVDAPGSCTITIKGYPPQSEAQLSGSPVTFTMVVTLPGTSTWLGAVSHAWTDARNWLDGNVAGSGSSVVVLAGTYPPQLSADATIVGLTIPDATVLDLNGHTLSATGDVDTGWEGAVTNGTLLLNGGSAKVQGELPNLVVGKPACGSVKYALTQYLGVNGSLTVNCPLDIDSNVVVVTGNVTVQNGGTLDMSRPQASLAVLGNAVFDGPAQTGLSSGTLLVYGDFTQAATNSPASFAPGGDFIVQFASNGTTAQHVSFATPTSSWFHDLVITSPAGISFTSDVHVTGMFSVTPNSTVTQNAPYTLTVDGATTAPQGTNLAGVAHLISTYTGQFPYLFGNSPALVTVSGATALEGNATITGALELTSPLNVGSYHLTVGDSLNVTGRDGELVMTDPNGIVTVNGNAQFAGKNGPSKMSAGTLEIARNFRQRSVNGGMEFTPGDAFLVRFTGSAAQSVVFDSPGSPGSASFFSNVMVRNPAGVTQGSAAYISDSLKIASGVTTAPALWSIGGNSLAAGVIRVSESGLLDPTGNRIATQNCVLFSSAQVVGGKPPTGCTVDSKDPSVLFSRVMPVGLHSAWLPGLR